LHSDGSCFVPLIVSFAAAVDFWKGYNRILYTIMTVKHFDPEMNPNH
jgi:hypothetical protein